MKPEITYYKNGRIRSEEWINEAGEYHRLDGPAARYWYKNGQLEVGAWWVDGRIHKLDGPAYQKWREDGQLVIEEWYIHGVEYKTEAEFQVAVDLYKANEIAELF